MSATFEPSPENGEAFLEMLVRYYQSNGEPRNFDTVALSSLEDIKASPGKIICKIKADDKVLNRYGTLHGGLIATIVDTVSSAALVTQSERSGMSLNLSVEYHSALAAGDTCLITAQVVKVGRTIATLSVEMFSEKTGKLVASGRHTKFLPAGQEAQSTQAGIAERVRRKLTEGRSKL